MMLPVFHTNLFLFAMLLISCITFISCNKDVYSGVSEAPIGSDSKIIVKTIPAGAAIYLDGKNMNIKTPDSLSWVKPGTHTVTLKLGLFADKSKIYIVQDSSRFTYDYNYYLDSANFGGITIKSTPASASIILNDTLLKQKTPLTLKNLLPNEYKIKVTYPNFRSDSINVDVRGGIIKTASFTLEDTTKWISYSIKNSPIGSNNLTAITIDIGGTLWIGSQEGYLFQYRVSNRAQTEINKWSTYLAGFPIRCLAVDAINNLWIGTSNSLRYFEGNTKMYDFSKFLPDGASVNSIAIDKSQNVWIGTNLGMVIFNGGEFYNGSNWTIIKTNTGDGSVMDNYITSISFSKDGIPWIGTQSGIQMYSTGEGNRYYNMSNMNLNVNVGNFIQDVKIDNNGVIWAVHKSNPAVGGITQYNGSVWSVINLPGYYTLTYVEAYKIYIDKNNYKWISTVNGLWKYMLPNDWTSFTTTNSNIPASQISDCVIDRNGNLWVATYGGGLGKLKKGNF